jgi:hypothetical protein
MLFEYLGFIVLWLAPERIKYKKLQFLQKQIEKQ